MQTGNLDITGKYFEPPSVTTAERNALTPTEGLQIYNSTTKILEWYNGSAWVGAPPITGTMNKVAKFDATGVSLADSRITDDGTSPIAVSTSLNIASGSKLSTAEVTSPTALTTFDKPIAVNSTAGDTALDIKYDAASVFRVLPTSSIVSTLPVSAKGYTFAVPGRDQTVFIDPR